jgi:hypothetical protein
MYLKSFSAARRVRAGLSQRRALELAADTREATSCMARRSIAVDEPCRIRASPGEPLRRPEEGRSRRSDTV